MNDITYCTGEKCNKKELCVRYMNTNPKVSYWFSVAPVVEKAGKQICDFFKRKLC